jgi:hypothetical protein
LRRPTSPRAARCTTGDGSVGPGEDGAGLSPEPPLRLALGNDAVDSIAAHHELLRGDLTRWEKLSRAMDLD